MPLNLSDLSDCHDLSTLEVYIPKLGLLRFSLHRSVPQSAEAPGAARLPALHGACCA